MSRQLPAVTQRETIMALLDRSKRAEVPIRKSFLQQVAGKVRKPGPLASLISNHDERAFDLYLLTHAAASARPFDVVLAADVWARALGLSTNPSARSAVSKAFSRLQVHGLIARERAGSRSRVRLLDEAGGMAPYTHPASNREPYFKLPSAYWTDDWHLLLTLPGKAMALIGLSLGDGYPFPAERAPDWYGISADTAQRGLAELCRLGLLTIDVQFKKAPLSPVGYTEDRRHTLQAPFGPRRRPASMTRRSS